MLLRLISGSHVLAWADQAVVSATSFVALIMIGRWTDASQLGAYAIGSSVLALLLAAQESLITRPYSIQLNRPVGTPAEHAFSSLILSFLVSAAAVLLLTTAALALDAFDVRPKWTSIVWLLAAATPPVLTREFARRLSFAHLRLRQVLMLDLAVSALNVVALVSLGFTGRLSAVTAFAALSLSCGVGAAGWLYLARAQFAFRLSHIGATLKQSVGLGKWLLSGQLALQVQGYMTYWLSTVLAGVAVTGIFTACMSIVSLSNPALFGFYNILTPKSVHALRAGGPAGLRRQAALDSLLLAAVMTCFCIFVALAGQQVMDILYPGAEYTGNGHILVVLALAALAAAIGVPASIALASAERARAVAVVMIATAGLNVTLVWSLMANWGLLGAAYGMLIAEAVGALGRWLVFLVLVSNVRTQRPDADGHEPTQTLGTSKGLADAI
jgi:O-antigen/teichoic acid export membrane protein